MSLFTEPSDQAAQDDARELPNPPRIDRWPQAVRSAELLHGTLVRCGPGLRPLGWPDHPRVRLHALAPWLTSVHVAIGMTAAWVWFAAHDPGDRLQISVPTSYRRQRSADRRSDLRQLRLHGTEVTTFGEFCVTTPLRTAFDLLHQPTDLSSEAWVACRLLALRVPGGAERIRAALAERRYPGKRMALTRCERIWSLNCR